jgi:hypothetical protein
LEVEEILAFIIRGLGGIFNMTILFVGKKNMRKKLLGKSRGTMEVEVKDPRV